MRQLLEGDLHHLEDKINLERKLLGTIIANNRSWEDVFGFLVTIHFSGHENRWIFRAIDHLARKGKAIDEINIARTIADELGLATLDEAGGIEYISDLRERAIPGALHDLATAIKYWNWAEQSTSECSVN